MKKEIKRNRPVATLIKEYSERKKGKVAESRAELHRRFDYLDYSQQKKILFAHLQSCRTDREWAYPRLLDLWDETFMPVVKQRWEEFHEERCSWLIIRHFSKEYIMEHFEQLAEQSRNYFHLCLRFGSDKEFVIDKERLSSFDYLYVMYRLGKTMHAKDATHILYCIIQDVAYGLIHYRMTLRKTENIVESLYPRRIDVINQAFYYICEMDIEETIDEFKEWSDKVSVDIEINQEWVNMQSSRLRAFDYNNKACDLLINSFRRNLPHQYKKQPNFTQKTHVKKLIETLGLEYVDERSSNDSFDLPF